MLAAQNYLLDVRHGNTLGTNMCTTYHTAFMLPRVLRDHSSRVHFYILHNADTHEQDHHT